MLAQVVYETNADLDSTHESMVKNPLVVADKTEKGLLWFKFKESRTVFQLSPVGKLQVRWNDVSEKRMLFRLVKNLLVAKSKEKLLIKPLKQQTWIDYPVPESFKLHWCDSSTEFVLKKPSEGEDFLKSDQPIIPFYASLCDGGIVTSQDSEKIEEPWRCVWKALGDLRRQYRYLREPSLKEVALRSGVMNMDHLRSGLIIGHWKEQSNAYAVRLAEDAVNLAPWLRFKESGELNPRLISLANKAIDKASLDVILRAQLILKNSPELVPKISGTELKWPEQTKQEWIKVFGANPPDPQTWEP